jgi:hypothetical protein
VSEEVDATTHQPTQTYVWGPAGLVFRQAADGARLYAHSTPDGSVSEVVDPATHLPAARYVYTPTGVAKMVPATGVVEADSSSLSDISQDPLDWKYLWHGQRFLLGDRLYHLNGGTAYDPFIGSTITSMHGTYTLTDDPNPPGTPIDQSPWQTWWDHGGKRDKWRKKGSGGKRDKYI